MNMDIKRFLNEEGKISQWPAKQALKLEILKYLAGKFELDKTYTEKEVNAIINDWHTFNDYFLLRRGLVDAKLMKRTKDGSEYWREKGQEE